MSQDSSMLPKRPPTPSMDALFQRYLPPGGRPRFELLQPPGVGWVDQAFTLLTNKVDWKNEPADTSGVTADDAEASRKWVMETQPAAVRACGWTLPSGNPNDPAFILTAAELVPAPAPAPVPVVQTPAPAPTPAPTQAVPNAPVQLPSVPAPVSQPSPPSPVVQQINQAHAESWLKKLGHAAGDVAGYATPENIGKAAAFLEALAPLFGRR